MRAMLTRRCSFTCSPETFFHYLSRFVTRPCRTIDATERAFSDSATRASSEFATIWAMFVACTRATDVDEPFAAHTPDTSPGAMTVKKRGLIDCSDF